MLVYLMIPFIIWTWGLTPLWVNIVITSICGAAGLIKIISALDNK